MLSFADITPRDAYRGRWRCYPHAKIGSTFGEILEETDAVCGKIHIEPPSCSSHGERTDFEQLD